MEIQKIRADLVSAVTCIEASIDFPEEGVENTKDFFLERLQKDIDASAHKIESLLSSYEEGRFCREGVLVAIVGDANVGKSSLLNTLVGEERVIVTPIAGTTRDVVEEMINIDGVPLKIVDTAGICSPLDNIMEIGIRLTRERLRLADLAILVVDGSERLDESGFLADKEMGDLLGQKKLILALNKIDLGFKTDTKFLKKRFPGGKLVRISALYNQGIDGLRKAIVSSVVESKVTPPDQAIISQIRHKIALEKTLSSLKKVKGGLAGGAPLEFAAFDLKRALLHLGEVVGKVTTEDILDSIFSRFCIGK
jgi:tRNA modification GTPase